MTTSVVVVGYGSGIGLTECLEAVIAQRRAGDEIVLVDNGLDTAPSVEGVRTVRSPTNVGFAGGCHLGTASTSGDVLVFVNSDAVVQPGALAALVARASDPAVGLVGGLVVLADSPDTVNSIGLPVHLSGLSWSGGYGEPVSHHKVEQELTSVSGALFACRRQVWECLGGMDESYFMYHEDTDLSLRCHLAGLRVVYCPCAVAFHAYDFSRNPEKMYLLERNRFLTVLADYPTHLLLRVLLVILLLEPLFLIIAVRDGWGREKVRACGWLLRNAGTVRARRRRVQALVNAPHALDGLLSPAVTQTQLPQPAAMSVLNRGLRLYWRVVRPHPASGH